ncbi:membrane-spanning 4-domains subfamily A member 6C-like [Nelusetta ayraudi]|uniref:membrane-spanning 4-domains subfamily A member 6C-like n=1 Tax=Nelusetta ayraudi TaxID=303726 RepID=UPI003F71E237
MSVTVSNADGVTVFTLTSDPKSPWPPLCQILKGLCYNPVCCSVSQQLKKVQRTSQSVLGTLHIMDGLLNIGLGAILICSDSGPSWRNESSGFPFWLGGLFIFFGIMCILSEKCPSFCLVILNVVLNITGVGFAIAAIVLYSINISNIYVWWICREEWYDQRRQLPVGEMLEKCEEGTAMIEGMQRGINILLIILSTLELCVALSSAVMGIKTLCGGANTGDESVDDPEVIKPLLLEAAAEPEA